MTGSRKLKHAKKKGFLSGCPNTDKMIMKLSICEALVSNWGLKNQHRALGYSLLQLGRDFQGVLRITLNPKPQSFRPYITHVGVSENRGP